MFAEFRHERLQHQSTFALGERFASQALSPNGMSLATGSCKSGLVKIWNTQTGQIDRAWTAVPLSPYPYINETSAEYGITALTISSDGTTLVTGGKVLKTWELKTGRPIRAFKGFGSLWDVEAGINVGTLESETQIGWIGMSIDGQTIVGIGGTGQTRNVVEVWTCLSTIAT